MKRNLTLMLGAGIGAGLMYLFDPRDGRRRRARLRDKGVHTLHKTRDAFDTTRHDVVNRWQGVQAMVRARLQDEGEVDDRRLAERVRAQIGRYSSHPRAIEVRAESGRITLSGPILARELERLMRRVHAVRGVREVDNRLEAHADAGRIAALQGEPRVPGNRTELLQSNWSPAARLLAGTAGAVGTAYGLKRRGAGGAALGLAGLTLLTRAAANRDLAGLLGLGGAGVDVRKSLHIQAPVEQVYALWSDYENLPHFMSHVKAVERLGEDRWRWTVLGPGGAPLEWEAVTTEQVPNERIAWRTEPGAQVQHEGSVRFAANPDGSTTVHVHLSYAPPGGPAGHGLARILGGDPKHRMDQDLMRMKSFIETGTPAHDSAAGQAAAH